MNYTRLEGILQYVSFVKASLCKFYSGDSCNGMVIDKSDIQSVPKMYLALTLYFEEVSTMMSEILGFSAFQDLYDAFDTLLPSGLDE